MKTFRWMAGLLVVMFCIGLSSCSDDDDDINASSLIGTWEMTHSKGYGIWGGEREEWDEDDRGTFTRFEENGTLISWEAGYENEKSYGTYQVKGKKIIAVDEDGEQSEATIKKLTSNTLELEINESGVDEGESYEIHSYETYTKR